MPITWRPEETFQDFIKDNSHSRQIEQRGRYEGRVFNVKGHIQYKGPEMTKATNKLEVDKENVKIDHLKIS